MIPIEDVALCPAEMLSGAAIARPIVTGTTSYPLQSPACQRSDEVDGQGGGSRFRAGAVHTQEAVLRTKE